MQLNDAPEKYLDFAMELAIEYMDHIATKRLGWRTHYECHFGEAPDVSVFHFLFCEEIHYLWNLILSQAKHVARLAPGHS